MFTLEQIAEIQQRGVTEKWPFAYLFNSLKSIGIERYEVNVLTHEIKFVGGGSSLVQTAPEGFSPPAGGAAFNVDGLKSALTRVRAVETGFEQFLVEIAAAGVGFFRVDMLPRTVTYHGAGKKDKFVEKVPTT